jgi:hypothetical protein
VAKNSLLLTDPVELSGISGPSMTKGSSSKKSGKKKTKKSSKKTTKKKGGK